MSNNSSSWEYVLRKVMKYARIVITTHQDKMLCLDCSRFPREPVTGRCGHTRCARCINRNGPCPCGTPEPKQLHVNILIRDIVEGFKRVRYDADITDVSRRYEPNLPLTTISPSISKKIRRHKSQHRKSPKVHIPLRTHELGTVPRNGQMRFEYALHLITCQMYSEAAALLIHVAVTLSPIATAANYELTRIIKLLLKTKDRNQLIHYLNQSVLEELQNRWATPLQVECPVCLIAMQQPVTTTCGHTFCRPCIKRTTQIRNVCPLCTTALNTFHLAQTDDTEFVRAIMGTITLPVQIDPNVIPIFESIIAYPHISCPLMINETDYRNIVKGVLDSGTRRFGMVALLGDYTYATYGTIVEVRDRVLLKDGRVILSTVGISRFVVKEKISINGCPYARILRLADLKITNEKEVYSLQHLAQQISVKVEKWLPSLKNSLHDINTCFGPFPNMNEEEWWVKADGPVWLWWLIAILPLQTDIQVLMLSTSILSKRISAVFRTLHAMDHLVYEFNTTYPQKASSSRSVQ